MQVAITGIGIVSALGIGVETNRKLLLEGRSALRKPQILSTAHQEWPMGEVHYSNEDLKTILHLGEEVITRNVLLGMVALREAISNACLDKNELSHIHLVNGTTVGGMDLTEQHFTDWRNGNYEELSCILQHEADTSTKMLANHFGLQYDATISTACSSALNAIIHGINLLRLGSATQVIVGGTEAMTKFHLNGFASLGILSQSVCKPFQEDRDGINLGEGAAYLVLEDLQLAQSRGAHIYGYIVGYGNACDAYHQTASSPQGDGALAAMEHALSMSNIPAKDIAYINAHGTATPNNDASELRAIERLFDSQLPRIESTKPLTGHTTSASGSIETIFTLLRMWECDYKYAMCNAFGFGGNDSSIVLSQEPVNLPDINHTQRIESTTHCISMSERDYKTIIPIMQARRMTPFVRQLIVIAKQALSDAHIDCPDGIVVGTRWGGMIPTIELLNHFSMEGEKDFSPALFMNSTHNSAAGVLAQFLQCKGYNTTIVAADNPFDAATKDAHLHLMTSNCKNILVCAIDEVDEFWNNLGLQVGIKMQNKVQAKVLWRD